MEQAGGIIFGNLPLLFAVGAAIAFVSGDVIAALAAIVALFIMTTTLVPLTDAANGIAAGNPAFAEVLGLPTLQTGVFEGLIAGIIAATCYKKFYKTELPAFLGFFTGKRLVPIMTAVLDFLVGLAISYIWQPVQAGFAQLFCLA
ncbi:PTS transporter subunit EIIC, partial [Cetobacterium somerae]|uniref:PTS transporter subunit EIIC n=1 Tax=Cetobacterium somerae TaxID=188913 RepID=UPI00211E3542